MSPVLDLSRHPGPSGGVRAPDLPGAIDGARGLGLSIAHELNQPLAAMALHASAAAKWLQRAEPDVGRALDSLAMIASAAGQAGAIVRGLQGLALGQRRDIVRVDVDAAVREALLPLRERLRGIELELALDLASVAAAVNRVQLQQVVTNLVLNAIEAHAAASLTGPRRIKVSTRRHGASAIELAVADNGPGVARCHHARLFAGAFSTKRNPEREAGGIGLSICRAIARAHGGYIRFTPLSPHGASFQVCLPLPDDPTLG